MRLILPATLVTLSVEVELGGAVALYDPELWQHDGARYVKLPAPHTNLAAAKWSAIPRRGPRGVLVLQLYWAAFEPQKPKWRYPATIEVKDHAGTGLHERDGHPNPTTVSCDIGREVDHWDHQQLAILGIP